MLTIRAEVQRDKQRSDGTYNLKVRFIQDRKVKRLSTSLFVTLKDLTKSFTFKEGTPMKLKIDNLILSYHEKCAKLQVEFKHYSLDDIVDYLIGERERARPIDFIQFSRQWIHTTNIKGAKNYMSAVNALIAYIGKE